MIKIERTFPAPASLAIEAKRASGKYDGPDVIKQLREDAHDKCYICEMKGLQDPVVEHLLPHKNGKYPDRKFDWNNLFWSCGHCNGGKNQQKYDEGIIDCCQQDPEELSKNPDSKVVLRKLKAILRRESAFAAFKRDYIRENRERFPQLMPYIA